MSADFHTTNQHPAEDELLLSICDAIHHSLMEEIVNNPARFRAHVLFPQFYGWPQIRYDTGDGKEEAVIFKLEGECLLVNRLVNKRYLGAMYTKRLPLADPGLLDKVKDLMALTLTEWTRS